ncbi:MAG: LacI family DNA-binding transcriptional regulator [Clostridia bacterium]|nr:LacI family DNA-binding transcriptional regulator [Clostridia bacterium]
MVTIKDIAREGGVSVSTVSRALAESPLLPKSTCVKIKEIANRLGYVKNEAATSLKTGVTQVVGVLSFVDDSLGFSHHLFAGILEGFAK